MYDFTDVLHALRRIYDDYNKSIDSISNDIEFDYLTEHSINHEELGNVSALWYKDESNDIAIILETGEEMTEQDKAKYLY